LLRWELEAQFLVGCLRLADKGFLNDSSDSISVRIPGSSEMLLVAGLENWREVGPAMTRTESFESPEVVAALHGAIYLERQDVGAVVVSSPKGARFLAKTGGILPPLFDEQVRHIGLSPRSLLNEKTLSRDQIRKAFLRGANAALLGERLLCLGMTCERVVFNAELFEKCAQAYVIAQASGIPTGVIPAWVRLIANRRLLKDERNAAECYLKGQLPEGTTAY
jgi:ribulose-5-phosphate 4-epimerase/fuculose-1-phosphate aldolase